MAFTHTWDNATPLNSEVASLVGQNIRDLKLDIQQRMAGISGLDAAKQNYEAGFAGVVYFATDTAKIYQWSGAAWVDITANFIPWLDYVNTTPVNVVNPGVGVTTGQSVVIPANTFQAGSLVEVAAGIRQTTGGGAASVGIAIGPEVFAFTLGTIGNAAATAVVNAYGVCGGADSIRVYWAANYNDNKAGVTNLVAAGTMPYANPTTIRSVTSQGAPAACTVTFDFLRVRVHR